MNSRELYALAIKAEQEQNSTLCAELLRQAADAMATIEAELAALRVGEEDEQLKRALRIISTWASCDDTSGQTRQKAMRDIVEKCDETLKGSESE